MEFLCERGADVNRGLRSSSLHYAACFGRPQIVKVWCQPTAFHTGVSLPLNGYLMRAESKLIGLDTVQI